MRRKFFFVFFEGISNPQHLISKTISFPLRQERTKVTRLTNTVGEKEEEIRRLEGCLADERARVAREMANKEDEGRIRNELTAMGAACRGERHSDIISHQKEALSEMRQRLKQLEQLRPPSAPSNDQAVQQVAVLKKEMAELRARQAIAANNVSGAGARLSSGLGGESEEVDERRKTKNESEISQERSAHKVGLDFFSFGEKVGFALLLIYVN